MQVRDNFGDLFTAAVFADHGAEVAGLCRRQDGEGCMYLPHVHQQWPRREVIWCMRGDYIVIDGRGRPRHVRKEAFQSEGWTIVSP